MLLESGYTRLTGTDYSEPAVDLARKIMESKESDININFIQSDILSDSAAEDIFSSIRELDSASKDSSFRDVSSFDIVLDKGTFDAISLSPKEQKDQDALDSKQTFDKTENSKVMQVDLDARKKYSRNIRRLMHSKSIFLITSCNWTEAELSELFEDDFELVGRIKHPSFTFGGVTGSTVSSVAFRIKP
ncbi:Protein-lysine N-methyltransferase mettl10 [Smittium mucronatum]|uniref:Protein-lysine N-methyltransferase mettl10 n=1 Tax=Smittium mucronatum TaxID=133383 RepID=A0A1R0H3W7_9FUNG|nr:Protein-lysine N-methyltransferase mettl10 [Smittium mucronatum]